MSSSTRIGLSFIFALTSLLNFSDAATGPPKEIRTGIDFVDPLIGTVNGGHVFPGATLPYSMAKAVADTDKENQAGFASNDGNITGFSHMHDSGTGGGSSLGNFPIFPQSGCPGDDITRCKFTKDERKVARINGTVVATPGYFAITLNSTIRTEMTVTNHTALYRFTFPQTPVPPYNSSSPYPTIKWPNQTIPEVPEDDRATLSPLMLIDLTDLADSRVASQVSVNPDTGRIQGSGKFYPSFGSGDFVLHFCADFSGASPRDTGVTAIRETGIFYNNRPGSILKEISVGLDKVNNSPHLLPAGAYVQFWAPNSQSQLYARVGVSFMSQQQACDNAEKEIPDFNFEKVHEAAREAWREKLEPVEVDSTGVSESYLTTFWSGIYRTMFSPQDYTGENPLWKSDEPYYDSFYCIWDSFRSVHQLITLMDPRAQARMIRSLIDIYVHEGKLPDCRMSLCKGFTQGGSNADILLADSFLKNLTDGIDWNKGYEAVVSDAEEEPKDWSTSGRGGLKSWKELGYIPTDDFDPYGSGLFTRSISRTVEYAYNDFVIAEMAKELGHMEDYKKYMGRSNNWKNMFNPDQKSDINGTDTGFVGFLQPKYLNGTWGYQDPIHCSPLSDFDACYLNVFGGETYEGSCWMYTFFVPGDHAALIETLGGPESFVKRLDYLHESGLLYIGDEQAFFTVYQYHYAGRPAKSAERIHAYIPSQFNNTVNGIPGNDDSGAMGSFAALSMMGIFPNPGQSVYFITPPFFPSVSITNPLNGNIATIKNINFDPSYKSIYIQSAKLDGESYTKNWLSHDFFLKGGTLELTLGPSESDWGTAKEDLPPSLSTGGF